MGKHRINANAANRIEKQYTKESIKLACEYFNSINIHCTVVELENKLKELGGRIDDNSLC